MLKLFNDNDEASDTELKTNTDYASHYNSWRQKEELNKLKTKYGDVAINDEYSDEDDSSSSDDNDDGVQLSEEFEKEFYKTLACLKKKDPRIYDKSTKFFKEDAESPDKHTKISDIKEKKKEPLLLKNYEKKMLLKTGGKFEEDNESDEDQIDLHTGTLSYAQEQHKLKQTLKQALEDNDDEENDWGGMFQKRTKSAQEAVNEENEYSSWLKDQKKELNDKSAEKELKPLKKYWNNPKLDKEEVFLRDYLLNKRYLEKESNDYIPTYEEIIHDSDEGLSEDEKNIETQEEFETKYNHRFEEPDEEYIKRYPRTMLNSVRKTDDRRKLKRAEIKKRKEEEKIQKQEELKQLKALKRKEIEDKIKKLKEITGNNDLAFNDEDLEEEFDPEAHDRRMQEIFNNDYYTGNEGDQKPEFPDLVDELGPWADQNNPHCEDDDFIMDCDYDPDTAAASSDKTKKKRNRYDKKGNKIESNEFDENDDRFKKYTDELYKLDYEDMIGDIPCRFKYREVVPNSFGLSIEEILIAKDRELNRWCSLKKATQHRPEHIEKYELMAYQKKATNEALKKKVLSSLYDELEEPTEDEYIKLNKEKLKTELEKNEDIIDNTKINKKKNKKAESQDTKIHEDENLNNSNSSVNNEIGKEENFTNKKHKRKASKFTAVNKIQQIENKLEEVSNINAQDKEYLETPDLPKQKKIKKKKRKISINNDEKSIKNIIENETEILLKETKITDVHTEDEKPNEIVLEKSENLKDNNKTNEKLSRRQKRNKKKLMQKVTIEKTEKVQHKSQKRKRKHTEKVTDNQQSPPVKKLKTNKKKSKGNSEEINISDSRLQAYGFNPKKFKNKLKYKKQS